MYDVSITTETDDDGSDETDKCSSEVTTHKPNGGLAGSLLSVAVAGEDVLMSEDAYEFPSTT